MTFTYRINDLLSIILLLRVATSIRLLKTFLNYHSNSAQRLTKICGFKMNTLFVLKCIVQEHPITMIFCLWVLTVLIFSYVIRILEQENPIFDFKNYYNSIWYCLVTLTSIGYGDFFPKTPLGKICKIYITTNFFYDLINLKLPHLLRRGEFSAHL